MKASKLSQAAREAKLESALRRHRRMVFAEPPEVGEAHGRAIRRLKATATARAAFARREGEAEARAGEKLARQGY